MNAQEFAQTIKAKHPEYNDIDDATLTQKVLAKYPQYQDMVDTGPSELGSFGRGVLSGIPGAEAAQSGIESAMDPKKTYAQAHQDIEDARNKDWETNPKSYGAGKGVGFVGTALAAPVAEGLGGAAAIGAGMGALAGADTAASPSDIPMAGVKGAGAGAVLGGAGNLASKLFSPTVAKGALASLGSKTTSEDIANLAARPGAVNNAMNPEQLGNKVADVTSDIGKASGQMSQQARGLLNPENSISAKDLKDAAMQTVQKYHVEGNPATAADQTAINSVIDQYQKLAQIAQDNGGKVPEDTLRNMIDRMQAATKDSTFGNPDAGASQTALKEFSGQLNDLLRGGNEPYAEAMKPSAELANLSSDAKSQFGIEPNAEGNLAPTDRTATRINNAMNTQKPEGAAIMDRIKNATGQDLKQALEDARTKANFEAPGAGAGLHALLPAVGYGLGRATGVPFGGIIGAGMGHFAAGTLNGGNIARGIVNMWQAGSKTEIGQLAAKFGPVLANAAKQGGNQLAATHFVLATSNPEYQRVVDHLQGDNADSGGSGGYHP